MNKGIIAGAAIALALTAPVTVFAEEAVASPSKDDARIVIEDRESNAGVAVNDIADVINEKWGTSFAADYVVSYVGEAYVVVNGAAVENYGPGLTLTISAADFGGELLVHLKNDGTTDVGATITLNSEDLSPIAAVKKVPFGGNDSGKTDDGNTGSKTNDGSTVNTGDSNNSGLWAGALVISALLAGAAIVMNKRNA